ncbi:MAG: DUF3795 domain-containing protein [Candidatus Thermoplasmatota archaeon]|nr:DUF3795 domain-containing protein [Candidatus Thermoplasmatota archaeon]
MRSHHTVENMKISTCGVVCSFCPRFKINKCSGCNPNPYCGMPDCAEKKGIKYCFECKEFPCLRHYGEENNLTIFDKKWLDFIKKEVKG